MNKYEKKVPLLTVLVPSYNHENYIEECLNAVLEIKIEKKVIVIDDGSTDGTPDVVRSIIAKNQEHDIEFIEKENSGLVSSLNLGLSKVETEFFYLVASDDIVIPKGIEEAIEVMIKNRNLHFFIGGGQNFYENTQKSSIYSSKHEDFFNLDYEERKREMFLNYPQPILLQSTVFRTSALKDIGGWDSDIISDDFSIFIKLFLFFKKYNEDFIFKKDLNIVLYRHHGSNSYKNVERQFITMYEVISKFAIYPIKYKAVGYLLGEPLLVLIKYLEVKAFFRLLKLSPWKSYPYAVQKIFFVIYIRVFKDD